MSRIVEYDSFHRRLWLLGQRCHHGAAGSVVAGLACLGLVTGPANSATMLAAAATGGALMAHDWKDHSLWFERGYGTQP